MSFGLRLLGLVIFMPLFCQESAAFKPQSFNPVPMSDDVVISMPCDLQMVFRRIATTKADAKDGNVGFFAGSSEASSQSAQGKRQAMVNGSFHDDEGFYFLMAKYELTQAQYEALSEHGCKHLKNARAEDIKWRLPAVNISKNEFEQAAYRFTKFLAKSKDFAEYKQKKIMPSVRLPFDDEWEFAARGGLKGINEEGKIGDDPNSEDLAQYAHFLRAAVDPGPSAIGTLKPNALGLFDMLGNVQEMMGGSYAPTAGGRIMGGGGGFSVRGGSYRSPKSEIKVYTRMERQIINPSTGEDNRSNDTGARFVISLAINQSLDQVKALNASADSLANEFSADENIQDGSKGSDTESLLKNPLLITLLAVLAGSMIVFCILLALNLKRRAGLRDGIADQALDKDNFAESGPSNKAHEIHEQDRETADGSEKAGDKIPQAKDTLQKKEKAEISADKASIQSESNVEKTKVKDISAFDRAGEKNGSEKSSAQGDGASEAKSADRGEISKRETITRPEELKKSPAQADSAMREESASDKDAATDAGKEQESDHFKAESLSEQSSHKEQTNDQGNNASDKAVLKKAFAQTAESTEPEVQKANSAPNADHSFYKKEAVAPEEQVNCSFAFQAAPPAEGVATAEEKQKKSGRKGLNADLYEKFRRFDNKASDNFSAAYKAAKTEETRKSNAKILKKLRALEKKGN